MDNKEVLVKLHFVTKYGVPISSYKVIKNYTLYKYLVTTHLVDKLYIYYSNEDCEIVDIVSLFKNAKVVDEKNFINSHNDIKHILLEKDIHQYNLFSLIDMTYSDTFGFTVENDPKFQKYSEFYKMFLDLIKIIILKYSNKQEYPKNVNELLSIELGADFINLLNLLNEPIDNENNIMNIVNKLNNKLLNQTSSAIINNSTETNKQKDKIIISKNQHGFFTFKDLIFDMKTGFVTGKWNGHKLDYLTEEDINLCKSYNLKYIDIKICNNFVKITSNNTELNNTSIDIKDDFKNILNDKIKQSVLQVDEQVKETNQELIQEQREESSEESSEETSEEVKDQTEDSTGEQKEESSEEVKDQTEDSTGEQKEETTLIEIEKITEQLSEILNENIQDTIQKDNEQNNTIEQNEPIVKTEPLNPNSIIGVIKPLDVKPSRGRRKISAVTSNVKAKK